MATKTFNIETTTMYPFRKWDVLRHGGGGESIVIRIVGQNTATLHQYKRHKRKWQHWIWMKWLRLKVWVGDFYKQ